MTPRSSEQSRMSSPPAGYCPLPRGAPHTSAAQVRAHLPAAPRGCPLGSAAAPARGSSEGKVSEATRSRQDSPFAGRIAWPCRPCVPEAAMILGFFLSPSGGACAPLSHPVPRPLYVPSTLSPGPRRPPGVGKVCFPSLSPSTESPCRQARVALTPSGFSKVLPSGQTEKYSPCLLCSGTGSWWLHTSQPAFGPGVDPTAGACWMET